MNARQWLSRYIELMEEVKREAEQAHYWEDTAIGLSAAKLSHVPKARKYFDMTDYVVKFLDLAQHCSELGGQAEQAKNEILEVIDSIDNLNFRRVLRLKYIDNMTYQQIADRLHYSKRQIHRIHGKALKHVTQCHSQLFYNGNRRTKA